MLSLTREQLEERRLALEFERLKLERQKAGIELLLKRRELKVAPKKWWADLLGNPLTLAIVGGFITLMTTTVASHFSTLGDGERRDSNYWIELKTTPQPFGGRRWWFVCPRTGRRAAKLYLPSGAFALASRQAYRLGYRSQRETPHDRALGRAFKLRHKLGADGGIGDYVPKPKWMRWRTYERKLEQISAAEDVVDGHLVAFVGKLERSKQRRQR